MEKTLIPEFERIWIDDKSWETPVAKRFRDLYPSHLITRLEGELPPHQNVSRLTATEFAESKRQIHLKSFAGSFFKRCPGFSQKKALTCCNYHVLNLGQQCNFNCSYCYLQSYLNAPAMMVFTNLDQALEELRTMAHDHGHLPFRIGTGEIIDSLSLDPVTLYSRELIRFFRDYPKWTLEMKTKSAHVDQFLDVEHANNVLISWSVNSEEVIRNEETGTASLSERLAAARKCANQGFQIGFHLDPMIHYPDWEKGYADLVERITSQFMPSELGALSVGGLRFQPDQRHMMRERFGMKSFVVRAETFPSEGGKMRYDSSLRQKMFDFVVGKFREHSKEWHVMMCMETPETWISTYKETPMKIEGMRSIFRPLPKVPKSLPVRNSDPSLTAR